MKTLLNALFRAPVLVMVALSLALSGCFGAVNLPANTEAILYYTATSVGPRTVAFGISQALADKPGAEILMKGSQYIFLWTQEGIGTAMWAIDLKSGTATWDVIKNLNLGGQIGNFRAVSDLKAWLMRPENGWTITTGSALASTARSLLTSAISAVSSSTLSLYMLTPTMMSGSQVPWDHLMPPDDFEIPQS